MVLCVLLLSVLISGCGSERKKDSYDVAVNDSSRKNLEGTSDDSTEKSTDTSELSEAKIGSVIRDDGYTVWNLQEINIDEYANIVGYSRMEDGTNYNVLIRDNQNNRLKVSDNCGDKTGRHGEWNRAYVTGMEFKWGEATKDNIYQYMESFSKDMEYLGSNTMFDIPPELLEFDNVHKNMKGITADEFKELINTLASTANNMSNTLVFSDMETKRIEFRMIYMNDEIIEWTAVMTVQSGDTSDGYCQVEYDEEKLVINLADKYNGVLTVLRYVGD